MSISSCTSSLVATILKLKSAWNLATSSPSLNTIIVGTTDIAKNPDIATKHKIAVVPTIIIFKDGEEVARVQADLSFKMVATREEVQEEINNQLMSDF